MAFIGPWEIGLLFIVIVPLIIIIWHSGKYHVKHRWIWILITFIASWLGLIVYMVVYTLSNSSKGRAIIYCPKCKNKLPINSKFCNNCGSTLSDRICPKCDASNPINSTYCLSCGVKLEI